MRPRFATGLSVIPVTAPDSELTTLDDVKSFMLIDDASRDDAISTRIPLVGDAIESYLGRSVRPRRVRFEWSSVPSSNDPIQIDHTPVRSIRSIEYRKSDATWETISSTRYTSENLNDPELTNPQTRPVRIIPNDDWCPEDVSTDDLLMKFRVEFDVGWTTTPPIIVEAAKAMVKNLVLFSTGGQVSQYDSIRSLLLPYVAVLPYRRAC